MPIYYVKPDSDNKFPDNETTPVLEPADGLRAVNVPITSISKETLATVVGLPAGITADDYKAITGEAYVAPTTQATTTSTTH